MKLSIFSMKLALASVLLMLTVAVFGPATAHATFLNPSLSNMSPNPDNSENPADGTPKAWVHDHFLRVDNIPGNARSLGLNVYYPVGTANWSSQYIKIDRWAGAGCQNDGDKGNNTDKFITVTISSPGSPNVGTAEYNIPWFQACSEDGSYDNRTGQSRPANKFFARYGLPGGQPDIDPASGLYKYLITIRYNDSIVAPNADGAPHNMVHFVVRASKNNAMVGARSAGFRDYPFMGRSDINGTRGAKLSMPFGRPCNDTGYNANGKMPNQVISLYDPDNGGGFTNAGDNEDPSPGGSYTPDYKVQYRVWDETDNAPAEGSTLIDPNPHASGPDANDWFTPGEGGRTTSQIKFTMIQYHRYSLQIKGIYLTNFLDVGLPTGTAAVFGDSRIDCRWRMEPSSTVKSSAVPGETVTFTHTATNVGSFISDEVDATAEWGTSGVIATGNQVNPGGVVTSISPQNPLNDKRYSPPGGDSPPNSRNIKVKITIPAGAHNGDQYCQRLKIVAHSKNDPGHVRSTQACVTVNVSGGPPPNFRYVDIQPVAVNGPDIEPTETTTIQGRVVVSNFPGFNDWGYNEKSQRATAQQVPITATPRPVESDYNDVAATATDVPTYGYDCPHANDYDRIGSTCYHHYTNNNNDTKAECEANGHQWNGPLGSGCRDTHAADTVVTGSTTEYSCSADRWLVYNGSSYVCRKVRYRCQGDTAWGSWGGAYPSCTPIYSCASDPTIVVHNSTSPPHCDAWTCPYSSSFIKQHSQPLCEYRCSNSSGVIGAGDRALIADGVYSDGTTSLPCRKKPSFSMTCRWDAGPTVTVTVDRDGVFCSDSVTRVGVTVGVQVCATKDVDDPAGWSPSNPSPGYRLDSAMTPPAYRQVDQWLWHVGSPSQGCSRVVAKPTFKVNGDIAAGGSWMTSCIASPAPASIVGWPHSPVYDASYAQYAAFASSQIYGFAAAAVSSNAQTQPPSALAFANTTASGERYGGSFGPMPCITDYAGTRPSSLSNVGDLGQPGLDGSYNLAPPILSGSNVTVPVGKQIVIYHTGDLHIRKNVEYDRSTPWAEVSDIPGVMVVVSGGNIYIDPSVSTLNGIYVAQPAGSIGGNIYTCATMSGPVSDNNLFTNCRTKLTVNGAFIANKLHLGRTEGTAIFGQTAEEFNYLPEVWLTPWPQGSGSTEVRYDAMTNLPPIL